MTSPKKTLDAATVIESFVDGTCDPYDWGDFLNGSSKDAEFQKIREECAGVEIAHPARNEHEWCNEEGVVALKAIAARLRRDASREAGAGKPDRKGVTVEKVADTMELGLRVFLAFVFAFVFGAGGYAVGAMVWTAAGVMLALIGAPVGFVYGFFCVEINPFIRGLLRAFLHLD